MSPGYSPEWRPGRLSLGNPAQAEVAELGEPSCGGRRYTVNAESWFGAVCSSRCKLRRIEAAILRLPCGQITVQHCLQIIDLTTEELLNRSGGFARKPSESKPTSQEQLADSRTLYGMHEWTKM